MGEETVSRLLGVRFGVSRRSIDRRGSFLELWRASAFGPIEAGNAGLVTDPGAGVGVAPESPVRFVQANLSTSSAGGGAARAAHRRQLDHWIVAGGRAFVALVDVRPLLADPDARPQVDTRELGPDEWVDIPAGVAHGFLALEPLELVYLVTNEYDGTDELGFAWDDRSAAVPWPTLPNTPDGRPILSDRDLANPSLAELVVRLRHGPS